MACSDDIDKSSWLKASTFLNMALTCQESSDDKLPEGLKKFKCGLYAGRRGRYTFIRILRTLLSIYHIEPMDSEEDWKTLRTMSCYVKAKLIKLNINTYAAALQVRDHMRSALQNDRYSLNDLMTYVCLVPE